MKRNVKVSFQVLQLLLKLQFLLGCFFVFFGTQYTHELMEFLYSKEKATFMAGQVLSLYCIYVPFMGINGVSEAFLQAVGKHFMINGKGIQPSLLDNQVT